jgi:hypothetical protein
MIRIAAGEILRHFLWRSAVERPRHACLRIRLRDLRVACRAEARIGVRARCLGAREYAGYRENRQYAKYAKHERRIKQKNRRRASYPAAVD